MRRLTKAARRDRGAAALILALLFSMGVLIGFAAFSVDVGSMSAQRRAVQNGADAVALSLAKSCGDKPAACTNPLSASMKGYLNNTLGTGNGRTTLGDGAGGLTATSGGLGYPDGVCFANFSPALTPICKSQSTGSTTGKLIDCPEPPATLRTSPYVEAHMQTTVSGGHILPSFFAQALGFNGANVQACARAAITPAGYGSMDNVIPITMSYCDWKAALDASGGVFEKKPTGTPPGYDTTTNLWPVASREIVVSTAKDANTTCSFNGHTAPGGFAWLNQVGTTCSANVVDSWVQGNTGNNYECSLLPYWGQYLGKTVLIPVFDCVSNVKSLTNCTTDAKQAGGTNTYYHIINYASFYISGWNMSGSEDAGSNNPNNAKYKPAATYMKGPINCPGPGGSGRCLSGWFTQDLTGKLPPADPSSPNLGVMTVVPAG